MTDENGAARGMRVLQRVVFPGEDLDVVPLYVETNMERGATERASEILTESLSKTKALTSKTAASVNAVVGEALSSIKFGASLPAHLADQTEPRRAAQLTEGSRVSFATYFNAFPAS